MNVDTEEHNSASVPANYPNARPHLVQAAFSPDKLFGHPKNEEGFAAFAGAIPHGRCGVLYTQAKKKNF